MSTSKTTILNCTQTTATIVFVLVGILFTLAGCAQLYKIIGLTDQQIADQVTKDQIDREQIIEGIRLTTTELITTAIAAAGAIASGFLAKWLGTEKKITKVLITGIEKADSHNVKKSIHTEAVSAGLQPKLHTRVKALT